jgi:hypothetical protein
VLAQLCRTAETVSREPQSDDRVSGTIEIAIDRASNIS